jgi:hypothetical protein
VFVILVVILIILLLLLAFGLLLWFGSVTGTGGALKKLSTIQLPNLRRPSAFHASFSQFPPPYPKITRESKTTTESSRDLSKEALEMCTRTLWHTLETTTIVLPDGETFVHTGDIDDLWLRDSAAQIHPLMIPVFDNATTSLMAQDAKLDRIVAGLIKRTAMYIRHDPYANAFRIDDSYVFSEKQKRLGRHDLISTWNYELDSACVSYCMFHCWL